jgi:hypothetical protein
MSPMITEYQSVSIDQQAPENEKPSTPRRSGAGSWIVVLVWCVVFGVWFLAISAWSSVIGNW